MSELNPTTSLSALCDELQSMETETFEILDHLEVGVDLAAAPDCGSCCSSCSSCSLTSCLT